MTSKNTASIHNDFELGADVMPGLKFNRIKEAKTDYEDRESYESGRRSDWYRSFIYRKKTKKNF